MTPTKDLDLTGPFVSKAFDFARAAHTSIDHRRKYTGGCYFSEHVIEVAKIVQEHWPRADWMKHQWAVAGALLHDVVEDVAPKNLDYTAGRIATEFGPEIAKIVEGLTDVFTGEDYKFFNRASRKLMEAGRIHLAGRHHEFGRIIHTIKCADLIQNSESIISQDPEFAKVYLKEKRDLLHLLNKADYKLLCRAFEQIGENQP